MEYKTKIDQENSYVLTVEEFKEAVKHGLFVDYDGFGYASNGTHENEKVLIKPSKVNKIPKGVTHVAWYNK